MSDEPGEARDSAEPEETAIDHTEGSADAETEFHPFDEVDEDFQPGPAMRVMGPDGIPQTVDTTTESDIPALSTESLVCMGDYSKFVRRNEWGETVVEFTPAEVQRAPDGRYRVAREVAEERYKERGEEIIVTTDAWIAVYPIRPQCFHYVRQLAPFHMNAAHKMQYRLCSARRTTEGTFMTVRDSGMYACDMREPRDAESAKQLDEFDTLKIKQGKERTLLPMFPGFGIFDAPKKDDKEN
jgi:hypothetical protein